MSGTFTPIKCPQCGSTEKETITESHFKCVMCQTEYMLDDNQKSEVNLTSEPAPLTETLMQELLSYGNPSMLAFNQKMQKRIEKKYTFFF